MSLNHTVKRIFIAIKLYPDQNFSVYLRRIREYLKDERIRWTKEENLHLTLRFIGDHENSGIPLISGNISQIALKTHGFKLKVQGLGIFRSLSYPRVLWTGIDKNNELCVLKKEIDEKLNTLGFNYSSENFTPHLTLGRMKRINDKEQITKLIHEYQDQILMESDVESIILFESLLKPEGPIYRPLDEYFFR